jgi:Zn-dependent M16 (insulinase) family peptidase
MNRNFVLKQERHIPEINSTARLFAHKKTGARLLSLTNNDENKVFGITFRTPPADSTGIAHIMEHSVLCGSRRYPVKEPFVELMKGSLNTFLNAFTYPDKTCYPVASTNLKDFHNLIDVYLDAVFYPLIPEHTLRQEGWHYELDEPSAPLTFKGVVFNEMKGNYSSPDNLLGEKSQQSLFPDTPYGLDSGGNPLVIPDLTYGQFKDFHDTYYHPSNAYIFFYGDDPEDGRLDILDSWLKDFDRKDVRSQIPLQPRFKKPRRLAIPYDAGDKADAKAYVTVNWLLPEVGEAQTTLSLSILSHILLSTPASPLRKALIDSGLGEDVTGGYEEELRQTFFKAGLKGVAPADVDKVEQLILDTLTHLAKDGIDPDTIAASLNTVEFALREKNTGRFPRGLAMMLSALTTWLHDGDPIATLAYEKPLAEIKKNASDGRYFELLITDHLLNNTHRATVVLDPDPEEGTRREAIETERLAKAKAAMSGTDLKKVIEEAAELKRRQETPDPPEALATIPTLSRSDLDRQIKTIPFESTTLAGVETITHDLFTNGIIYLDLGFDLHSLPQDLLPYAGLFGRLLTEMGTGKEDFVKLTQRIGRSTGGIHASTFTSAVHGSGGSQARLFLRGKAVLPQTAALLDILKDVLLDARLENPERFKQIVLEEKAGMEAALVPNGHGFVNRRLRARFDEADWIAEQMNGVSQLFFLRELAQRIEKDWPAVRAQLEAVRQALVNRTGMLANLTVDAAGWKQVRPLTESFLSAIPAKDIGRLAFKYQVPAANEGLAIPAQVNYVGKGADLYAHGYKLHGSALVINNFLHASWLWEKIRVQGGAYGGFCAFDIHSGVYTYLSYRDPNLLASLDNYDGTAQFLRKLDLPEAELTKSIIGVIGELDAYLLPDAKGWTSLTRHLIGYTEEMRQQLRDEVLGTTAKDFRVFAEALEHVKKDGQVVVLGPTEALEKANKERNELLEIKKVL